MKSIIIIALLLFATHFINNQQMEISSTRDRQVVTMNGRVFTVNRDPPSLEIQSGLEPSYTLSFDRIVLGSLENVIDIMIENRTERRYADFSWVFSDVITSPPFNPTQASFNLTGFLPSTSPVDWVFRFVFEFNALLNQLRIRQLWRDLDIVFPTFDDFPLFYDIKIISSAFSPAGIVFYPANGVIFFSDALVGNVVIPSRTLLSSLDETSSALVDIISTEIGQIGKDLRFRFLL